MAEGRLSELQASQEYNLSLSRQCQDIEVWIYNLGIFFLFLEQ
jgi:hypothetical protein